MIPMFVLAYTVFALWFVALVVALAAAYCNRQDRLDEYEDDDIDEDDLVTQRINRSYTGE